MKIYIIAISFILFMGTQQSWSFESFSEREQVIRQILNIEQEIKEKIGARIMCMFAYEKDCLNFYKQVKPTLLKLVPKDSFKDIWVGEIDFKFEVSKNIRIDSSYDAEAQIKVALYKLIELQKVKESIQKIKEAYAPNKVIMCSNTFTLDQCKTGIENLKNNLDFLNRDTDYIFINDSKGSPYRKSHFDYLGRL